jgi:8-amino-7-oxononanoate synthase
VRNGHRSIFHGIESLARRRAQLVGLINGPNPLEVRVEKLISPTAAIVNGRPMRLFGTNNYLGLTFDGDVRRAAIDAIGRWGAGTTASRMASGNLSECCELESELADFLGKRTALVFSTGFQANLGTIAGLCGARDTVVVDEDCHASIYDAVALSGARRIKFRHNDLDHLRAILEDGQRARPLIAVESVYSVAGDIAPLRELVAIKDRYGGSLLVDEAHSVGLLGPRGAGLVAELGLTDAVEIVTGTFSKSFGLIGGFAASSHPDFGCLRYSARPFMFTAALPPSIVSSARTALRKIMAAEDLRRRALRNAAALRVGLERIGLRALGGQAAIVTAVFDDLSDCYVLWRGVLEQGFYANMLLPPATSHGSCAIRFSLSAEHIPAEIDALLAAVKCSWQACRNGRDRVDGVQLFSSPAGIVVGGLPSVAGNPRAVPAPAAAPAPAATLRLAGR